MPWAGFAIAAAIGYGFYRLLKFGHEVTCEADRIPQAKAAEEAAQAARKASAHAAALCAGCYTYTTGTVSCICGEQVWACRACARDVLCMDCRVAEG